MMTDVFVLLDVTDGLSEDARVFTTYKATMNAIANDAAEWEADFIVNIDGEDGSLMRSVMPCFGIDHELNADGDEVGPWAGNVNHRCVHFVGDIEYSVILTRVMA